MSDMSENLTLFEDWVLFILFKNHGNTMSEVEFMMQCCDTAIGDLTERKMENDLNDLMQRKLIENVNSASLNDAIPTYKITGSGILTVRKDIIKPVMDLFSRDDYSQILELMGSPLSDKISQLKDNNTDGNNDLNKQSFTTSLINFGVNNIGPLMKFISKISSHISEI